MPMTSDESLGWLQTWEPRTFRIDLLTGSAAATPQGFAKSNHTIGRMMDKIAPSLGPETDRPGARLRTGAEIRLWYVEGRRYLKMNEVWGSVAQSEVCTVQASLIDPVPFDIKIGELGASQRQDHWGFPIRELVKVQVVQATPGITFGELLRKLPKVDPWKTS